MEEGAQVEYSILMPGARVKKGAKVRYAILGENVTVCEDAVIGCAPTEAECHKEWGVAVIGNGVTVKANAKVKAGAMVDEDVEA